MAITNQIFEHYREQEKKRKKAIKLLKEDGYIVYKKKKNYLELLNENYFKEKGFIKIESKMNKINKPRQYRSRQGRSDKRYIETMKATALSILGLLITLIFILYDSIV
jgi:hypothetical protein